MAPEATLAAAVIMEDPFSVAPLTHLKHAQRWNLLFDGLPEWQSHMLHKHALVLGFHCEPKGYLFWPALDTQNRKQPGFDEHAKKRCNTHVFGNHEGQRHI